MALGPNSVRADREALAARAEEVIDRAIGGHSGSRVMVSTSILPIDRATWAEILAPKYRAAGWRVAEWAHDPRDGRDGNFIDLQA